MATFPIGLEFRIGTIIGVSYIGHKKYEKIYRDSLLYYYILINGSNSFDNICAKIGVTVPMYESCKHIEEKDRNHKFEFWW